MYDSITWQDAGEGDFNIAGWDSSLTGQAIEPAEMRMWVDETVARIRELGPRRAIEVGCGTGLLLTRLAPMCDAYIGFDFSQAVLGHLRRYIPARPDLAHVELRHARADELASVGDDSVDLG